jgi:Uncharacterized protein conserved in bacteria (DUF2169)
VELINETRSSAELVRSIQLEEDDHLGLLIAKTTYRIRDDGSIEQEGDGAIPVLREPLETELGYLPTDLARWKLGVDLMLFGRAHAPGGRPTTSMMATVGLGDWSQSIRVIGDRRWRRSGTGFAPSAPEPFVEMPMTWSHAFGGCAPMRGTEVPHPYNPAGRGYNTLEESVDGSALPNLEDPASLIQKWTDDPIPITFAAIPSTSMFMADNCAGREEDGQTVYEPGVANRAHPKLRLPRERARGTLVIEGMTRDSPLAVRLPEAGFTAEVWLAERHYSFPLELDTLGVLTEARRMFAVYRCLFTYAVLEGEARLVRLRQMEKL